ncbi:MAG: enoyl-CoA hydratase [Aeromicrobium sp.]|nr:MAG: enoyl-CoA hydratase [Aeromicrobium sp.]
MSKVTLESHGDVRVLTLDSPEHLNALNWSLLDSIKSAVKNIEEDRDARALVVTGAGRAFCAGADLETVFGDRTRPIRVLRDQLKAMYESFLGIVELSIPTVAAVNGPAVGAGLNIALACDLIITSPKATLAPTFSSIGLHPGGGCTWLLNQRIGPALTKKILFDGQSLDADTALALGISQEINDDPLARAIEIASNWAGKSPTVMRDIKSSVAIARDGSLEESVDFEALAQADSLRSAEFELFISRFTGS